MKLLTCSVTGAGDADGDEVSISWILRGIVFQEFWLVRGAVVSHGRCHEVGLSLNGDSLFEGPLPRKKRIWLAS